MKQQQHGDVLIQEITALPKGVKKLAPKGKRWILAEGEVTGHAHAIEQIEDCCVYEKEGVVYITVDREVKLRHEEHHTQTIEPGNYRVGIVQEYDYLNEMARNVAD